MMAKACWSLLSSTPNWFRFHETRCSRWFPDNQEFLLESLHAAIIKTKKWKPQACGMCKSILVSVQSMVHFYGLTRVHVCRRMSIQRRTCTLTTHAAWKPWNWCHRTRPIETCSRRKHDPKATKYQEKERQYHATCTLFCKGNQVAAYLLVQTSDECRLKDALSLGLRGL